MAIESDTSGEKPGGGGSASASERDGARGGEEEAAQDVAGKQLIAPARELPAD